ncbi:MAG: dihydroorotate dehydrogenase electron transfer subunit [Bacteroidales bacterium]|jgi:dihydroorotate dehydrogenase electron transfer subunit|nr:dihydroorotate dehydrogenase electron transfer subunit [Bacteroidales bacterium]
MKYRETYIHSQEQWLEDVFMFTVPDENGEAALPGQFYMLKWTDDLPLMRPISIFKQEKQLLSFVYRVVGDGTRRLSLLEKGAPISLLGPLGIGFPCENVSGQVALVGGGVGIPPLYETAKVLNKKNIQTDIFLGFKDRPFGVEDFAVINKRLFLASEDKITGCYHGRITDLVQVENYNAVFTCGPEPMMYTLLCRCREKGIPVWLSMEKRMGCGIGACLVCNCETRHGMMKTCTDGPVFSGADIIVS